jgi:hypothetical protein
LITEGTAAGSTANKSTGTKDSISSPVSPFAAKTGSSKTSTSAAGGDDDQDDEAGRADEDEPTGANDAQERQSDDDEDDEEGEEMGSVNNTNIAGGSEGDDSATTDVNARQVSREEAEGYAKEAGGLLFFEASAKTGKGVQEIFTEIG